MENKMQQKCIIHFLCKKHPALQQSGYRTRRRLNRWWEGLLLHSYLILAGEYVMNLLCCFVFHLSFLVVFCEVFSQPGKYFSLGSWPFFHSPLVYPLVDHLLTETPYLGRNGQSSQLGDCSLNLPFLGHSVWIPFPVLMEYLTLWLVLANVDIRNFFCTQSRNLDLHELWFTWGSSSSQFISL